MRTVMAFLMGAAAGALGVLAVQRLMEEYGVETPEELVDRMGERLLELEERLGDRSESTG